MIHATSFVKYNLNTFVLICCLSFVKLVNYFIGRCPQIGQIAFCRFGILASWWYTSIAVLRHSSF